MEKKFILRDLLAQDRTHLANERTLLAYWRTAIAFLGVAAFIIKFFPSPAFITVAIVVGLAGIVLLIFGTKKYYSTKKMVDKRLS